MRYKPQWSAVRRMLGIAVVAMAMLSAGCEGLSDALGSLTAPTPTTEPQSLAPATVEGKTITFTFLGCGLSTATFRISGGYANVTSNFVTNRALVVYSRTSDSTATLDVTWATSSDRFTLTFTSTSGGTFSVYVGSRAVQRIRYVHPDLSRVRLFFVGGFRRGSMGSASGTVRAT